MNLSDIQDKQAEEIQYLKQKVFDLQVEYDSLVYSHNQALNQIFNDHAHDLERLQGLLDDVKELVI